MDAAEIHEAASEAQEKGGSQGVAVYISMLAVLLAITSMGGGNASKDMMSANIAASDTYSFYQAKSVRQTSYKLAVDQLTALKSSIPSLSEDAVKALDTKIASYQDTIKKYESDLETGEGKRELLLRAQGYEKERDHAAKQDPFFDYSEAMEQIAIVMASVSIVTGRRWVLWISYLLSVVASALVLNAFFLIV
ncbi:DUF4337 domain-containing protein [Azospirillaceae bacterium]